MKCHDFRQFEEDTEHKADIRIPENLEYECKKLGPFGIAVDHLRQRIELSIAAADLALVLARLDSDTRFLQLLAHLHWEFQVASERIERLNRSSLLLDSEKMKCQDS
jgi:hypothetical protein